MCLEITPFAKQVVLYMVPLVTRRNPRSKGNSLAFDKGSQRAWEPAPEEAGPRYLFLFAVTLPMRCGCNARLKASAKS